MFKTHHEDSEWRGLQTDLLGQIDLQEKLEEMKLLTKCCSITLLYSTDADCVEEGVSKSK